MEHRWEILKHLVFCSTHVARASKALVKLVEVASPVSVPDAESIAKGSAVALVKLPLSAEIPQASQDVELRGELSGTIGNRSPGQTKNQIAKVINIKPLVFCQWASCFGVAIVSPFVYLIKH